MSLFDNSFLPIKNQIDQYAKKAMDFFEKTENTIAYKTISNLLANLDNLRYNITIVGSFNRGKSTLLNTLMERADDNISPIDKKACTSAIVKYLDKNLLLNNPREVAKVIFNDNKLPIEISFNDIRDYVVEANNPNNIKGVKTVEVYGDFPQWSKAVTIIDSPGQNTTYEHHDMLLTEHLPHTDAIIFLIAGDLPLDAGDIKLLKELNQQQKSKIFFVLTKVDDFDDCPDDLNMVLEYTKKNIEEVIPDSYNKQIYPVAAERVFDAYKENKPKEIIERLKQETGIKKLENDLETFILKESDVSKVFVSRCKDIVSCIKGYLSEFSISSENILSEKEFDYEKFNKEKLNLEEKNKDLKKELENALKTFEQKCNEAISDFEYKAKNKLSNVNDELINKIKSDSIMDSVYKSFNLQKDVEQIFYKNYDNDINKLNLDLNSIQNELNDEFEKQIRIYKGKLSDGLDKDSASSGIISSAICGTTVVGGGYASAAAIASFTTSLTALSTASAAKVGFIPWLWYSIIGGTPKVTGAVIAAKGVAVTAGLTAVATTGIAIAAGYGITMLCHHILKNQQENRIPEITNEFLEKLLNNINNSLNDNKSLFIKAYREYIDKYVEQNLSRINEIEQVLSGKDFAKIKTLKQQVNEAKELIGSSEHLVRLLPAV